VQISLSGEDEAVATNYLEKEIGTCPVSIKRVEKASVLKGYVTELDAADGLVKVDVGVFEPKVHLAVIPLSVLQAQLAGEKKVDLKKIAEAYGLHEKLPLKVKVAELPTSDNGERLMAELSPEQVEKFRLWQQSLLDRLVVLGSTAGDVEQTLQRTGLKRDVIEVERLGFFEFALTCKFGTDAAGLIPRLGRYMRGAVFVVFTPRRLSGLIGEMPLTL